MARNGAPAAPSGQSPDESGAASRVDALVAILTETLGSESFAERAAEADATGLLDSGDPLNRQLALERLVFGDRARERYATPKGAAKALARITDAVADLVARRSVERDIEARVEAKLAAKHADYVRSLRVEALREVAGPETASARRKLEELTALDGRYLAASALALLRPAALGDVVGQDAAVAALLAKLATPFPQHVILYGPPGVGKTTVARLALEAAKARAHSPFAADAPFVEAGGATLRWDPREITNPLLGSVHDPIYQGTRRDFAEGGVPEPKLGLVTKAHGGVLFIDEIGEMDAVLQTKLLKVLEDKRVPFESSYYDPEDPAVPAYVRKLFTDGAPADFVLVGATTREPAELDAAVRSRCAEVFFEPLAEPQIAAIVRGAAGRLGVELGEGAAEAIAEHTIEGRRAAGMLADAHGHALERLASSAGPGEPLPSVTVTAADVATVARGARLASHTPVRASAQRRTGAAFGLGVARHAGSLIEIEAAAFPARDPGKGTVRFNGAAGEMARDSVFTATSVLRATSGLDPLDYDLHVNAIGGGNVDGPSAGLAVFVALSSALTGASVPQDVAITGELSLAGRVRPVGGIAEKLHAARRAGMRLALVPRENARDVDAASLGAMRVVLVDDVAAAFAALAETAPDGADTSAAARAGGMLVAGAGEPEPPPAGTPAPEPGTLVTLRRARKAV